MRTGRNIRGRRDGEVRKKALNSTKQNDFECKNRRNRCLCAVRVYEWSLVFDVDKSS